MFTVLITIHKINKNFSGNVNITGAALLYTVLTAENIEKLNYPPNQLQMIIHILILIN